jgi:hypothetical protein
MPTVEHVGVSRKIESDNDTVCANSFKPFELPVAVPRIKSADAGTSRRDLVQRLLRDQLAEDFEAIRVDSEEEYQGIVEFINRFNRRW